MAPAPQTAIWGPLVLQVLSMLLTGVIIAHIHKDYRAFIALGPGGTPQTWGGYFRIKLLGLFCLRNTYASIAISDDMPFTEGNLQRVPPRKHLRPRTKGIAPHRQVEQWAGKENFTKLVAAIEGMTPGKNNDLVIGTSCFEKHGTGLFTTCTTNSTCRGEIVHVHPSDGSMHLTLHPADVNAVLEAGWGERHPLAGVFFNRFLPAGFMMVYAPQNDEEIETVTRIIQAAYWYVSQGHATARPGLVRSAATIDNYLNQRQVEDPAKALAKI